MLIETISFTTTPQEMLTSMVRIISDRSVGAVFFGNDRLMDFELMGGDARKTIISEMQTARQAALPAARGAVRFQAVADADHARAGPDVARRSEVTRAMNLNTIVEVKRPTSADEVANGATAMPGWPAAPGCSPSRRSPSTR